MAGWDSLPHLIAEELKQRQEEGCNVTDWPDRIAAAGNDPTHLNPLYDALMALPIRPDFPFVEPSDLAGIRAERLLTPLPLGASHSEARWQDKFLGAWQGRCVGCALGKPLENWPFMAGTAVAPGWQNVYRWFAGANAWPITGYVPAQSAANDTLQLVFPAWQTDCLRENIRFMPTDDDMRYTVLGLILLEERGLNFDTWDVGKLWHSHLTYGQMCTAETQAYLNFAQVTTHLQREQRPSGWQQQLDWVRTYRNPYREWIGAQIRADGLAYAVAGNPELAAELAWRDASLSHVKNGIYGEMFVAAMIAAAFVEDDVARIVQIGLGQIPQRSRLAHDIRQAIAITQQATSQLDLVERIWNAFSHYHPVHTNNNAALVTAALLWSQGDFTQGITTAVLGGWDTDCNGATVGSILGAKRGASALPNSWVAPLNDTLYAELSGFHPIAISECAWRSHAVCKRLTPKEL